MKTAKTMRAPGKNAAPSVASNRNPRSGGVPEQHVSRLMPSTVLQTIVRSVIALILIWAGLSKLGDPVSAYTALLAYQLPAPAILLKLVAVALPWLELLCGLMLLINFHRHTATLATGMLFAAFLLAVGQAVLRGLDIACGCFNLAILGIDEASASARFIESVGFAFFRNMVLLAGTLFLLRADPQVPARAPETGRIAS